MKLKRHIISALLALVGLVLSSSKMMAQQATSYTNSFDTSASVTSWLYQYGIYEPVAQINYFNNTAMIWNSTNDDTPSVSGSGSLEVSIPWNLGSPNDQAVFWGTFDNEYGYDGTKTIDGTKYTNIVFDVYVDPTSPTNQNGNYGTLNVGLITPGWSGLTWNASAVALPLSAGGAWYHVVVPIDITTAGINNVAGIFFDMNTYNGGSLQSSPTPSHFYIDNLEVIAATVPVAPPTLVAPYAPVQGLNMFSSLLDGNLNERTSIETINKTGNGWYNAANPVTYSATIASFPNGNTYAGYQSHIFITTGNPPSYETAPDFNETNLIVLEIHENTDGVTAYASFRYKINEPNSNGNEFGTDNGTAGTLATLGAPTVIGTWSITFNNNTSVTVSGPGGVSTNFSISAAAAAQFVDPLNVYLGAQPNSTVGYGQAVVYSSFSITGNTTPLSDNFLTDTSLNTNLWTTIAGDTTTVQLVPAGSAYWLAWNLPDGGFSLQAAASLAPGHSWNSPTGLSFTTAGQRRTLLASTSLPSANQGYFRLIQRTFSQLQVLLPGETAAPGTPTGKTGTPTPVSLSTDSGLITFTVNAVDAQWNLIPSATDTVTISTSDGGAITPLNAALVNGTMQFTLDFGTTGNQTITATDVTDNTKTANTSTAVSVTP